MKNFILLAILSMVTVVFAGCQATPGGMYYQRSTVGTPVIYESAPPTVFVGVSPRVLERNVYYWNNGYYHYNRRANNYVVVDNATERERYIQYHHRYNKGSGPYNQQNPGEHGNQSGRPHSIHQQQPDRYYPSAQRSPYRQQGPRVRFHDRRHYLRRL